MQFPESWLREFCNPPLSTQALSDLLTMSGMEVEEARPVAPPPESTTHVAAGSNSKEPRRGGRWGLGGTLAGGLLGVLVLTRQPGLAGLEPAHDALPASYVGLLLDALADSFAAVATGRA